MTDVVFEFFEGFLYAARRFDTGIEDECFFPDGYFLVCKNELFLHEVIGVE